MYVDWSLVALTLGGLVFAGFVLWVWLHWAMEKEHHRFQHEGVNLQKRSMDLEERKFEVWKTANLSSAAQQGSHARRMVQQMHPEVNRLPTNGGGGRVVPFPGSAPPGIGAYVGSGPFAGGEMTQERMEEIAALMDQAKGMSEEDAKAFLAEHGIENVSYFRSDD